MVFFVVNLFGGGDGPDVACDAADGEAAGEENVNSCPDCHTYSNTFEKSEMTRTFLKGIFWEDFVSNYF